MDPYPYRDDYIPVNEAVRYISKVVYPNLDFTKAKMRVRDRIRKAADKGHLRILKRQSKDEILAIDLFTWAGQQKHWGILYQVPGLPVRPNSGSANLSFSGFSVVATGIQIPVDRQELERQFTDLHLKHTQLLFDYEQLQQEHSAVVAEVKEWRKKDADLRKQNSQNASQPKFT